MSHHSNFIFVFVIIMLAAFTGIFIQTDIIDIAGISNTEYSTKLTAASHSGVNAVDMSELSVKGTVWDSERNRRASLDAFYTSLESSFQQNRNEDNVKVSVPLVLLIDTNGYYINYLATANAGDLLNDVKDYKSLNQITDINTWSANIGGSTLRFTLNDYVYVTTSSGIQYEGDKSQVASDLIADSGTSDLTSFLSDSSYKCSGLTFEEMKKKSIIDETTETIEYYINQQNRTLGSYANGYFLEIPSIKSEDWHRFLENPTLISFMQGRNSDTGKKVINIYSYAGGEVIKTDRYFLTKYTNNGKHVTYYHSMREALSDGTLTLIEHGRHDAQGNLFDVYSYTGSFSDTNPLEITTFYTNMSDCAAQGAYPCPDCVLDNRVH